MSFISKCLQANQLMIMPTEIAASATIVSNEWLNSITDHECQIVQFVKP